MISALLAKNTSVSTYDRSGRALAQLGSEPVERIAFAPVHSSTSTDYYKDKVTLSPDGIEKSLQEGSPDHKAETGEAKAPTGSINRPSPQDKAASRLSPEEEQVVLQLKARDQEVKTHEAAHLANAGHYARGGPSYSYQLGPDGRRYAVGGEVPIDISEEKTPEATIAKMEAIRRAALAPAEPSSADRSIAAAAGWLESQARHQLQVEQTDSGPEAQAAREPSSEPRLADAAKPDSGDEAPLLRRSSLDVMA